MRVLVVTLVALAWTLSSCAPPPEPPEAAYYWVKRAVENSLDKRGGCLIRGPMARFDDPISEKDLQLLCQMPLYRESLKSLLLELVDDEADKRSRDMAPDLPMIAHVCEIMGELGDPAFIETLLTARSKSRCWMTHGASARAIRRITEGLPDPGR